MPTNTPSKSAPPARLLRVREAAHSLGLAPSKVYELCYMGELDYCKIGKAVRIPTEAIEALIERTRRNGWVA